MPRTGPYTVRLTTGEAAELQRLAAKYTLPYFQVQRAKIVLLAAEGLPNEEIVTPTMARRLPFSSDGFGLAAPCGSGQASCNGYVFYERARQLAPSANVGPSLVRSRVLAHELGHLLGLVHSERGLMRAEWNPRDFGPNSLLGIVFTPWECQRIHAEAAARATEQAQMTVKP